MAITMGVAAFMVHWEDPLSDKEHALLFFFPALVLALMGPGKWSLDRK
jgi:putative oxidoreductase